MSNTEVSEEAKLRISDSSSSVTEADVSIPPITIPQVNTSNKSRSPISILPNDPKEMRKKAYYQNGIEEKITLVITLPQPFARYFLRKAGLLESQAPRIEYISPFMGKLNLPVWRSLIQSVK
ncbi:14290_t:CDS:2 [Entrophospora sp. SA101]|nr:14290_t:CDS:2 [Entrophospora sp. SA101]